MLSLLLGLHLLAAPDDARVVDTKEFAGESVTVTLKGKKHRLVLRDELLDMMVDPGAHTLTEAEPLQAQGPLLLVECSKVNKPDGQVRVLGHTGLKVKGPKIYIVLALEPFPGGLPGVRERMVKDNGTAIFTAMTADVLQVPTDHRTYTIEGLDPASTYRVKVAGKPGIAQVIVSSDRPVTDEQAGTKGDAAWTATRQVLRGGDSGDLPAGTRRISLILAGTRALTDPLLLDEPTAEVTVQLVKGIVRPGRGDDAPAKGPDQGQQFMITMARQALRDSAPDTTRTLMQQCLTQNPKNAECHLLLSQAWMLLGDTKSAVGEACKAARYGEGDLTGENARQLLGGDTSKCPKK